MQNPNEDTEWNEILRQKGILPPKPVERVENSPPPVDPKSRVQNLTTEQLQEKLDLAEDELIDEDEARFLEQYRRERIAAMMEQASKARFGAVREISKADWKTEVNEAGDVYVVIHIAAKGNPLCTLVDEHLRSLAQQFPMVKFLRGEVSLCIPDYPDCNLPSLLIYKDGDMKSQLIGPKAFGGNSITVKDLEWRLSQLGVIKSKLKQDPSKRIRIKTVRGQLSNRLAGASSGDDDDDDDEDKSD